MWKILSQPKTGKYLVALLVFSALFIYASPILLPTSGQYSKFDPVQNDSQTTSLSQIDNSLVAIGVWPVNIFDFAYTRGTYTVDLYIYFYWTNENISSIDWHFANGYPITSNSILLIKNYSIGSVKSEIYRATAELASPPDGTNYPFDTINVTISIDMFTHGNNVTLSWFSDQTGIDPQFNNPGWKTDSYVLTTSIHSYPVGVQVPRAEMVIIQQRQRASTSIAPFIPPTIFAVVCAVSFLFGLKEPGSVALRIGLNTSMLVTTLLFSFSAGNNIPPASGTVLFSAFILAVLFFMVSNLVVTIIGVVGWAKYKNEKRTRLANQLGFILSIVVGVAVFFLLFFLLF